MHRIAADSSTADTARKKNRGLGAGQTTVHGKVSAGKSSRTSVRDVSTFVRKNSVKIPKRTGPSPGKPHLGRGIRKPIRGLLRESALSPREQSFARGIVFAADNADGTGMMCFLASSLRPHLSLPPCLSFCVADSSDCTTLAEMVNEPKTIAARTPTRLCTRHRNFLHPPANSARSSRAFRLELARS